MKHLVESAPTFEDWEGLHDALSDAYFPHAMHPSRPAAAAARSGLEVVDLDTCRLAHIRFGATVGIDSEHPGAMAVNIPLAGRLRSRIGSEDFGTFADSLGVPGVFWFFGGFKAQSVENGVPGGNHSPYFAPDDVPTALSTGVRAGLTALFTRVGK